MIACFRKIRAKIRKSWELGIKSGEFFLKKCKKLPKLILQILTLSIHFNTHGRRRG